MDTLQASNTIKRILEDNNTQCTLVDGSWGIGKTHLIKTLFEQEVNYELIYVSAFGKNSVKEIEKTLLINLIPGFKDVTDFGGFTKLFGNLAKDMVGKFTGVNIENYINSFSIEDIKNNKNDGKRKIICLDDLERKSDSINMKELLGLIERASTNFDIILIANTDELAKEDLVIFNSYREKVIDNVLKINNLNRDILKLILVDDVELNKNEIIDIYFENIISFGSSSSYKAYLAENINNLRIFKKYIELISRAKVHVGVGNIDKALLKICKAVVYDYYFPKEPNENKKLNFDDFNIYNDLKKLFLFEKLPSNSFKLYKSQFSQIRRDITYLYNLYYLNDKELQSLINQIDKNIKNEDLKYFIDQASIISLASALEENSMLDEENYKELLRIGIKIYEPRENLKYEPFIHSVWNDIDSYGNEIECHSEIKLFIEKLNSACNEKYNNFMNERINNCIKKKEYDRLLEILKDNEITDFSQFEIIFDYYFDELINQYSNTIEEKIKKLIHLTKSEIILNFFEERIKKENSLTNKKKYKYFNKCLDFKLNWDNQAESQIEYQMNYPED